MEDNKTQDKIKEDDSTKGLLSYDNDDKQTLFSIFGIELTAPKGLKNPRIVYISFIIINFLLLIFLKNIISR
ncbi:hypothetical protein EV06_0676 [Prochlorococcus sp. MIT 0602]|nr:hypothetical protein EV06_0676 [Prochlorococcus sp. MIT 0602]KGG18194.1 hypothetical protein EV07_0108 [Prochlorococcus sp. MIT 0603]